MIWGVHRIKKSRFTNLNFIIKQKISVIYLIRFRRWRCLIAYLENTYWGRGERINSIYICSGLNHPIIKGTWYSTRRNANWALYLTKIFQLSSVDRYYNPSFAFKLALIIMYKLKGRVWLVRNNAKWSSELSRTYAMADLHQKLVGLRAHEHEDKTPKSAAVQASSFPTPLPGRNRPCPPKYAFGRQRMLSLNNQPGYVRKAN